MPWRLDRLLAASTAALLVVNPCAAQTHELGTIAFPTSGSAAARPMFLKGVALLHSFEYEDAAEAFRKAQRIDPTFALAYWGEALTYDHPLWGEQDSTAARAVLRRLGPTPEARALKARTAREKAYLAAAEALYGDGDKPVRAKAYAEAMRSVRETYPSDMEAAAFYALARLGAHPTRSTELRPRIEATAVAEAVFRRNSQHPGAAHYLIHAYDDPQLAPLGLHAALTYARIAPAAEHAVHMPSHIFLQLGMWDEVVASNEKAFSASQAWARRRGHPASEYGVGLAAAEARDTARLRAAEQRIRAYIDSVPKVSRSISISHLVLQAHLARLQARSDEAASILERAASLEDSIRAVGPPYGVPARETLGQLLLARGEPENAAKQFELTLLRTPNRSQALLGLARCAVRLGDQASASRNYRLLLRNWRKADPEMPEVEEARAALPP